MEYGIDFKSNYTTLYIITMLYWKRMNENKKMTRMQIPPGGMGNGLERSYSELFLLLVVTISENWYDSSWFLYIMKPRAYKVQKLKISVKKGDPGGIQKAQKSLSNSRSSFFLLYLLKTRKLIRLKYSQKHSESTFGSAYF